MMRIAVVGLGLMGMLHAGILKTIPGVEAVTGIDIDADRLAEAAAQLGIPARRSLAEIIDDVDAVSVTLPDELHVEACTMALSKGRHVLVEKPLATTVADAQAIVDAEPAPNRLMVGQLLRFDLRLLELRRRIVAGQLGKIEYIRISRANTRSGVERLGGRVSVVAFLGVHDLDLLLWLTGERIERVRASGRRVHSGRWDVAAAHIDLSNGALAVVENHWLTNGSMARGALASVEVFGSMGTALLDLSSAELELATDDLGASLRIDSRNWSHDGGVSGGSLRREIEAFVMAVREGGPMPVTGIDGLRAVAAVELVEHALETGEVVEAR